MRLVEIRLLEGPNLYRLGPTVKVEVTVGRARPWSGTREPARSAVARLGATVGPREQPDELRLLGTWCRRLRTDIGEGVGGVAVHRGSDPGHWVVTFPWAGAERARAAAEGAVRLALRGVSPARRAQLTGAQSRELASVMAGIEAASSTPPASTPPAWVRDAQRRVPVVSVSGTNGKSTVTRLISHILIGGGRRVGTTTSDGVYRDERLVEAGDWTGPGGAGMVLGRGDIDVAVLETARGGILLRGVGYESNEVSVLTNVSSDHLDLQGIHTLPELAEVKATICRITRPTGRVILNADDRYVAAIAGRVAAPVAYFSLEPARSPRYRRHVASGGLGWSLRAGWLTRESDGEVDRVVAAGEVPIALGGLARYNVANALAAAAAADALGVPLETVAEGLRHFRPTADLSPGRLNLFQLDDRLVIVDFAHNEAGVEAILDVARGLAGRLGPGPAPVTVIVGTAGDRPTDTLRGITRIATRRADRVVIKETLGYLRGRPRAQVVAELRAGIAEGGGDPVAVPVYPSETAALQAELALDGPGVLVLMCHEERGEVFALLDRLGARPADDVGRPAG